MNYNRLEILFSEVVSEVAEEVAYFLTEDESLASRRILVPAADTDRKLLTILWNEAAAWLAYTLISDVSVELHPGEVSGSGANPADPLLTLTIPDIIEVSKHPLIRKAGIRALAAHIGAYWLNIANHLSGSHSFSRAEQSLLSLKSLIIPRASLFPRSRLTLHPF